MKKDKILIIIAIAYLAILVIFLFFIFKPICAMTDPMICHSDFGISLNMLWFYGIPSWIIFIYLIINKMKKHNNKK